MTNKLENVKAATDYYYDDGGIDREHKETITEALTIYQAILEKRVLLVPVEATSEINTAWQLSTGRMADDYKAMTQAVDQDELLKEILG